MSHYHKIGDVWDMSGEVSVTEDGAVLPDMTGWVPSSQLRTLNGTLIATFTCSWVDATQRLVRVRAINTGSWPAGPAIFDLRFTSPTGDSISTSTEQVMLYAGATSA